MNVTTSSAINVPKCAYCGGLHDAKCPSVKAFEYDEQGRVKRVEFFAPNDYAPVMLYGPHGTEMPRPRPWYQDPVTCT